MKTVLILLLVTAPTFAKKAKVMDGLPKDEINKVVSQNRQKIRDCYDAVLTDDSSLNGKVVVKFDIQPDGKVSAADIKEDGMGSERFSMCLLKVLRALKFPKSKGTVTEVSAYPFYLNPGK